MTLFSGVMQSLWFGIIAAVIVALIIAFSARPVPVFPRLGIIGLVVITAVVHLSEGLRWDVPLFLLNFAGYIGLLAALYLPLDFLKGYRNLIRWALIGYTLLTIVLYFVMSTEYDALGLTTKLIEVAIVALLFVERSQPQEGKLRPTV